MPKNKRINFPVKFNISTRFNFGLILLMVLLVKAAVANPVIDQENDWTLWHHHNDILIYYRNNNQSNQNKQPANSTNNITIKAQFSVRSSLSGFLLFLQDTTNVSQWLFQAHKSKIIKQINANENISITYFSGLWPMQPRDMVIKTKVTQHSNHQVDITSEDASHLYPELQDSIRMTVRKAHWTLTPQPHINLLNINYLFSIAPNGNIPTIISDKIALKSMLTTIENLKSQLPQSPWQEFQLQNISEPPTSK